ncbi:FAD-binding oxidoreductase [Deinococcus aestuarii]|uniref:FAD-binding oxidoreductase n=1 Tax=Deinococcus aestuarii TaxID=2774531 RepID=UPI001C0C00BF|nr:FAD-binding oxidoreductase [Deinococcus aestuarii]
MTAPESGPPAVLKPEEVAALASGFRGSLLAPGSGTYEQARRVWNGVIDKYPALILQPRDTADVTRAVRFARDHHLPLSVRGGGHNVAGGALCEGGVVVDLCLMRGVTVDPRARTARVGGGATWAEVDAATQAHGLAAPGGVVSDTGVAGLTLGGGLGWLRRRFGLSCDHIRAFEVVTAGGEVVRADASEHPDLYWALRGGGGAFGVVTAFEFDLQPVGPEVMFAMVFYPASSGLDVLRAYREFAASAPDEVSSFAICGTLPEAEVFPPEAHGQPFVLLAAMSAGDPEGGEAALRPLREITRPIADFSARQPFVEVQRAFDEDYPAGRRYYWKSAYLRGLPDEALRCALDFAAASLSPLSTVDLWHLGGAIDRIAPDATAYPHRGAPYLLGVEANWEEGDAASREANVTWARRCVEAFSPFSPGGTYLNFPGFEEDADGPDAAHGDHLARLEAVRRRYDPGGLFHLRAGHAAGG